MRMRDTDSAADIRETGRIEAFSDGVLAIAITLLILEIQVPHDLGESTLLSALVGLWPSYFAFVTSFFTIGIMWINHHRLFRLIVHSDQLLLVLNGLLLLGITFVPFPTAVLAEHMLSEEGATAALVYNGTFLYCAILFNLLWRYASHRGRLLGRHVDPEEVKAIDRQYAFGPVLYAAAAALALVNVLASVGLNLLLAVFFAIPRAPAIRPRRVGTRS